MLIPSTTYTSAMWSHVEIVLRLASCSRGVQWVVLALAQWHPSPQVPSGTPPLPTTTSTHNGPCTQYTGPKERWTSCYSFKTASKIGILAETGLALNQAVLHRSGLALIAGQF